MGFVIGQQVNGLGEARNRWLRVPQHHNGTVPDPKTLELNGLLEAGGS